jgi:hypothetical protein
VKPGPGRLAGSLPADPGYPPASKEGTAIIRASRLELAAAGFREHTSDYALAIHQDEGLCRRLSFASPRRTPRPDWEVVTWPGGLTVRMLSCDRAEAFTFTGENLPPGPACSGSADIFERFRPADGGALQPALWAQAVTAGETLWDPDKPGDERWSVDYLHACCAVLTVIGAYRQAPRTAPAGKGSR